MAIFSSDTAKGIAIGLGAALLAPLALAAAGVGRPAARAAVKAGLLMLEKGRETAAELAEIAEDLLAEAQAEIEAERAAAAGGAAPQTAEAAPAAPGEEHGEGA